MAELEKRMAAKAPSDGRGLFNSNMQQLLPSLREEEYAALKADIGRRGILVPVEVDAATGAILDGHHRFAACWQLGLDPPPVRRVTLNGASPVEYALSVNLIRRQMGQIAWAQAFEALAEARGIRLEKGGDRKSTDTVSIDSAEKLAEELGVAPRTARRRRKLAAELVDEPDLAAKVDSGEMTAKRARRVARERRPKPKAGAPSRTPSSIDLRHGDFREVLQDVGSVDLIFTDPPYPREYLPLWGDLAKFAARALKPNGLLIAYSGQYHLPSVLAALEEHLQYVWLGGLVTPGQHNQVQQRHIRSAMKPLLFFARAGYEPGPWFEDVFVSAGREKEDHPWQQSIGAAKYFIERLTDTGALVVDPFLGSGTGAVAAHELGRRFVGSDVNAGALAGAKRRLS